MNGRTAFIPFDSLSESERVTVTRACAATACTDAKEALADLRASIQTKCEAVHSMEQTRNELAIAAAAAAVAAAVALGLAMAAMALGISTPIAVILAGVAAALALVAAAAAVAAAVAGGIVLFRRGYLEIAQSHWPDRTAEVRLHCPEYCQGDLDVPACP